MPGGEAGGVKHDEIVFAASEALEDAQEPDGAKRHGCNATVAGIEIVRLVGDGALEKTMIANFQNAERARPGCR